MPNTFIKIGSVAVGAGSASTIEFTSIPSTYTDLVVLLSLRSNEVGSTDDFYIRLNGVSTGGTYQNKLLQGNGSTVSYSSGTGGTSGAQIYSGQNNGNGSTANTFTSVSLYIPNYKSTTLYKSISQDAATEANATQAFANINTGYYQEFTAVTSISFTSWNSTWKQHSTATLYGINNS